MIHRLIIYWHRIKTYIKEVKNFNRLYPKNYSLLEMALFFWPWFYSLRFGASPLQDEIPWMTFKSIEFLKSKLKKNMRIFEYGSGGSTIFWGRHGCETVSVEHDQNWYNLVQSEIHKKSYIPAGFYCVQLMLTPPMKFIQQKMFNGVYPKTVIIITKIFIGMCIP